MLTITHPSRPVLSARNAAERGTAHDRLSDEVLIKAVAAGDRQAMHLIYARHNAGVYRYILRLIRNAAVAEDLVSDVFLDVWRGAGKFRGKCKLSTWVLAIARHKAFSALRKRREEHLEQDEWAIIKDPAERLDCSTADARRSAVVHNCLGRLSAAHREIIDLVYYHENTVEEAAVIVGIPANTVKTRMFYARSRMRELLESAGIDSSF